MIIKFIFLFFQYLIFVQMNNSIVKNFSVRLIAINCWSIIISNEAGLVGFEPTTAGLRVRCATWLRYRPTQRNEKMMLLFKLGI